MEPYFIEYTKGDDPLILKLEGIDQKEAVNAMIKSAIYVRKEMRWMHLLDTERDEENGYNHLVGYQIENQQNGRVCKIVARTVSTAINGVRD